MKSSIFANACFATLITFTVFGTAHADDNSKRLDREDKYVACVIGRSLLFIDRRRMNDQDSQVAAYASCDRDYPGLNASLGDDEGTGLSDFINSVVTRYYMSTR